MKILNKRVTMNGCPTCMVGYDAEIKLDDDGEIIYIHVSMSDGTHYSASTESIYDYMSGVGEEPLLDFIEMYDEMDEVDEENTHEYESSKYAKYYKMAYDMIMDY